MIEFSFPRLIASSGSFYPMVCRSWTPSTEKTTTESFGRLGDSVGLLLLLMKSRLMDLSLSDFMGFSWFISSILKSAEI